VICFTFALQYISSGVLAVMIALYPLITAILAHQFLEHEKLTAKRIAGLALAFSGSLVIILTGTTGLGGASDLRGHLLSLLGVIMSAIGAIYMRRHLTNEDAAVVTAGQVAFSVPLLIPFIVLGPAIHLAEMTGKAWFAVVYAGVIGSFIGYMILFLLIKRYGATIGALPGYLMPIAATLLGALVLGEIITLPLILGALMVLIGVVLVSV
jgi:drug/metabolite transporter (DMT)-like permease